MFNFSEDYSCKDKKMGNTSLKKKKIIILTFHVGVQPLVHCSMTLLSEMCGKMNNDR